MSKVCEALEPAFDQLGNGQPLSSEKIPVTRIGTYTYTYIHNIRIPTAIIDRRTDGKLLSRY